VPFFDAASADRLGAFVIVAVLLVTALYAGWLLLMRLVVARQIAAGTMLPDAGAALLRRLNSGVLILAIASAIFAAPFSPFESPNPHATTVANAVVDAFALIVYGYLTLAIRRMR
jgi:hypothetical protein